VRGVLGHGDHPDALNESVAQGMRACVATRGLTGQHYHLVPGLGQMHGQGMHVPPESAHHYRRVLPGDDQDPHAGVSILASKPANGPSARRHRAASSAAGPPRCTAAQISYTAWAWVCARTRA